jgi:hypothetical protein
MTAPADVLPAPRRGDYNRGAMHGWPKVRAWIVGGCVFVLCACGRVPAVAPSIAAPSLVEPTALILAGLRDEEQGDINGALPRYREALAAARRVYGDDHPNVGFAQAALGVWQARFGSWDEAAPHLRASRQIDERHGAVFVNIAETRLPASASDGAASALICLRLRRDLLLCVLDGGCSPARVLGLGEALGAATP